MCYEVIEASIILYIQMPYIWFDLLNQINDYVIFYAWMIYYAWNKSVFQMKLSIERKVDVSTLPVRS